MAQQAQSTNWSFEVEAISDLASTSGGCAAAVTIDHEKQLAGLDSKGRLLWRIEGAEAPVLVAKKSSLFAALDRRIVAIDPASGVVRAVREIDPPLGGWSRANALVLDGYLLTLDASGLLLLAAETLETKWRLPLDLDRYDAIQQLAHSQAGIAAVSNEIVMLVSEQGALQ